MKKILSILAVFSIMLCQAQWKTSFDKEDKNSLEDQKRLSYGYYLGLNYFDFKIHPMMADSIYSGGINQEGGFTVESKGKMGFSAGLMGRLKINEYVDLYTQPGIHFAERTLKFTHIEEGDVYSTLNDDDNNSYQITQEDTERTIKSSYIDIPVMLHLHGDRWFNTRPYIQAGLGYAMNLQSNESSEDDNEDGVFRLKTHGFNWQVEGGVSIYFRKFKLTPSVKGIFFINNELVADDPETIPVWAGSMKSLHTRAIMFSLKFE